MLMNVASLPTENLNPSDASWIEALNTPEDLDFYVEVEDGDESVVYKINQDLISLEDVLAQWTDSYVHTSSKEHAEKLLKQGFEPTKSYWSGEYTFAPVV